MLVSAMYLLFVMPISLCNMADSDVSSPELQLAFFCVYWMQYSINFFIYHAMVYGRWYHILVYRHNGCHTLNCTRTTQ